MDQAKHGALPPTDDIPEARRDTDSGQAASHLRLPWMLGGLGAIALFAGGAFALLQGSFMANLKPPQPMSSMIDSLNPSLVAADGSELASEVSISDQLVPTQRTLLGHKAYEEAPGDDLVAITADGRIKLRSPAAAKFQAMVEDARRQGITLVPLSGFRSHADQEYLFFGIKEERAQMATQRAEVSAPPGYSEHHTGYAIDIGDADFPDSHLQEAFADTPAYGWLAANATRYGFELSFLPDNDQGVAFEPWHWRFVGDRQSLETFYQE